MKKKVAKGLLVAVVASNQILGPSVAVNGMLNTTDTSEITLETNTNTDVITEDISVVVPNETEENESEETDSSEITKDSEADEEVSEVYMDIKKIPRLESSSQIQPATVVDVSTENDLIAALNNDNVIVKLEKNITLTAPLEIINKNTIVIDGQDNTIKLNENVADKKSMFVVKNSDSIVVKNVTMEDYYSTGIVLYNAANVFVENVVLKGQHTTDSSVSP